VTSTIIRQRLQHAAWWMSAARSLSILLNLAVQVVLARLLSPHDFGSFALLASALSLIAMFGMRGMNDVSVRFIAAEMAIGGPSRATRAAKVALRYTLIGLPIVAAVTVLLSMLFGSTLVPGMSQRWDFALLLALGGVALAVQQVGADSLRGFHELHWASLFSGGQAGGPLCVLIFVLLMLTFGWHQQLPLATVVLLYVSAIGCVLPLTWTRVGITMRRKLADGSFSAEPRGNLSSDMLRMGFTLMAVQLLTFLANQSDIWIGGQLLPREQLALYHASRRMMILIGIPLQVSMITISSTIAEMRARNQHQHLEKLLGSAAALAGLPSLAAFLFLAFFSKPILGIVFGPFYQQATWPLVILIMGTVSLAICGSPIQVLNVAGGHTASLWINVISSIILYSLAPWWTKEYGISGLASATAVSFTFTNVAAWIVAKRMLGIWTHANVRALLSREKG
jgi:O-antigen/teichoic acid export membrane protein